MLPLMYMCELFFIKRIFDQKIRLRHFIKEIYLSPNGEFLDVIYMNQTVVIFCF